MATYTKAKQRLNYEQALFDQTFPWRWRTNSEHPSAIIFDDNNKKLFEVDFVYRYRYIDPNTFEWKFAFEDSENEGNIFKAVELAFSYMNPTDGHYGAYYITGTGEGIKFRLFATLFVILLDFIKKHDFDFICFSAKEPSRIKLYSKFFSALKARLPFKFIHFNMQPKEAFFIAKQNLPLTVDNLEVFAIDELA